MSLLAKAAHFEKLCKLFVQSQKIDPNTPFRFRDEIPAASLSGPTPRFKVPYDPEFHGENVVPVNSLSNAPFANTQMALRDLNNFATQLINFDLDKAPGASVDVNQIKNLGNNLIASLKSRNLFNSLNVLKNIMNATQNGGGNLYMTAKTLYSKVQQFLAKQPSAKQPPAWLTQYIHTNNKSPAPWLDQYMKDNEQLKDEADEMMSGMQASLMQGPAVNTR